MIKNIRRELMRLFYNDYSSSQSNKLNDEMEVFFDALKKLDELSAKDVEKLFDEVAILFSRQHKSNTQTVTSPGNDDVSDVLQTFGIEFLNYENITVEQVESLQANDKFTKALALQLANAIGISKKSYKSRKEIFLDIFRMVDNRDTLNATKNALSSDTTVTNE